MNQHNSLIGIVMCGGKSTRMGTDKGLIKQDGVSWAALALSKLQTVNVPSKISINPTQREAYSKLFAEKNLIVDTLNIPGPLAGLLSCSEATSSSLLILACDMTDILPGTIQELITAYQKYEGRYEYYVFKNNMEAEPLLGIYTYAGLEKIKNAYKTKQLKKYSLKSILETGNTYYLPIRENQLNEFTNYNNR